MRIVVLFCFGVLLTGCSVFGDNGVESAPYTLLQQDQNKAIEIRRYDYMILVSTRMQNDSENRAFRNLFDYITGDNKGRQEIAMTAPVMIQDPSQGEEIAMTAPVFVSDTDGVMSFVMPNDFTLESTPEPNNPDVWVTEVKDYKVAAITFSGLRSDSNIEKYTTTLMTYVKENNFSVNGPAFEAGYNGPLTLPMFRKNEVLIPIN